VPPAISPIAAACASLARSSTTTPMIQSPADMTALDFATNANVTPARLVAAKRPVSTRYVIANVQKSSVAFPAALLTMHGQTKLQLQASMYSPAIDQVSLMTTLRCAWSQSTRSMTVDIPIPAPMHCVARP
jgi:hypothetical protein